jgi:hypothetical protein
MRWRDLFADLEGQAEAWERADLDAEVADRSRAELGSIALRQRLSAAEGHDLVLRVDAFGDVSGRLVTVGRDWLLLDGQSGSAEHLVLMQALLGVHHLGARADPDEARGAVMARMGVAAPLRAIARDRAALRCVLRDGSLVLGTPDRIGADHLDVVLHDQDVPVGQARAQRRMTLPFSALTIVSRAASGWG